MAKLIYFILLVLMFQNIFETKAGNYEVKKDSLLELLNTEISDTIKINLLYDIAYHCVVNETNFSIQKLSEAENLLNKLPEKKYPKEYKQNKLGTVYNLLARAQYYIGNISMSIDYYDKSIIAYENSGNVLGKALSVDNSGIIYNEKGDYVKSVEKHLEALKTYEALNDTARIVSSYVNIGRVFKNKGEENHALEYYEKAAIIAEKINHKLYQAICYNNIGALYNKEGGDYNKALDYFLKAYEIKKEIQSHDKMSIANTLSNIGNAYEGLKEYNKAFEWHNMSLKMREEISDRQGMITVYNNLAQLYFASNNIDKALLYALKAMNLSDSLQLPELQKHSHNLLADIYEKQGLDKKSLYHYKQYILYRDSLTNIDNTRLLTEKEMQFEFDKKEQSMIAERQKLIIGSVALILFIVIIFSGLLYNRFKIIKTQNQIIEEQKEIVVGQKLVVEEKNKEILDSIQYAKRIQNNLLTPESYFEEHLINNFKSDFFILFMPKDIVSGDFYWAYRHKQKFLVAAADCTGHGVPGAFMSMLGISNLNQLVQQKNIFQPDLLLNELKNNIIKAVNPEGAKIQSRDGMDISLCCFDFENKKVDFALANNSLYQIRNGNLTEIKPDKFPVGVYEGELKPFTKHSIQLTKNDTIYLFSDGFADQFGGPKGKKFKYSQFKELLLSVQQHSMTEPKNIILEKFNDWKSDHEQVDDICIIGIKINE
jgi:tetratricopeptide (TPR) repeat protein